jgi:hypothetical protein
MMSAHLRTNKWLNVREKLFEGVNRKKNLTTCILLEVDHHLLQTGRFALLDEFADRVMGCVEIRAIFIEAGDAENGDRRRIEKVS